MKRNFFIGLLLIGLGFFSVSALFAQQNKSLDACKKIFGPTAEDSLICVQSLSLYGTDYEQWKKSKYKSDIIDMLVIPWRKALEFCPCSRKNLYIHGSKILKNFINKAKDPAIKEAYIDTLMQLYDNRIKYFGQEGSVMGYKAQDFYRYRTKDYETAYEYFKKSVELQGNKSKGAVLVYYFQMTIKMATTGKVDSSLVVENYDKITEIIDYNIEHSKKPTTWINDKGAIEAKFEPFATCKDLISIFTKKFNETPDDPKLLKKITSMLDSKKCNDSELFFNASVNLYKTDPSPVAAFMLGKMFINKKEYPKAIGFLEKATELNDDNARADAYYYLAFCYQTENKKVKAREMARKALAANPEKGNAYILIGDLYAASNDECATDPLAKKAVYWVAVDYYNKAKRVDPSVVETANKRISSYSKYFPIVDEFFMYDYNEGDSYTVECWINETTKVRPAK
jgi:tetratricopeptide (TPR) repeat protein